MGEHCGCETNVLELLRKALATLDGTEAFVAAAYVAQAIEVLIAS